MDSCLLRCGSASRHLLAYAESAAGGAAPAGTKRGAPGSPRQRPCWGARCSATSRRCWRRPCRSACTQTALKDRMPLRDRTGRRAASKSPLPLQKKECSTIAYYAASLFFLHHAAKGIAVPTRIPRQPYRGLSVGVRGECQALLRCALLPAIRLFGWRRRGALLGVPPLLCRCHVSRARARYNAREACVPPVVPGDDKVGGELGCAGASGAAGAPRLPAASSAGL